MKTQYEIAKNLAEFAHHGQYRRDGVTPYITHPMTVADKFSDDMHKAVAILHDAVEDSNGKVSKQTLIDAGLDKDIVDAIMILTKTPGIKYVDYIKNVNANSLAKDIKIQDILHNLSQNPKEKNIDKYNKALEFLKN